MIQEVLISNARLKIKAEEIGRDGIVRLSQKNQMRAQVVITSDENDIVKCYDARYLNEVQTRGASKAYVILKTREICPEQEYSIQELRTILTMIVGYPKVFLDTVEDLCLAVKDCRIIEQFYSTYSKEGLDEFEDVVQGMLLDYRWRPEIEEGKIYTKFYKKGRRYSVYRLIKDLVADHARILIDPDLVGEYKRITASKTVKPENIKYITDALVKVSGYVGNRTRANLSLQYKAQVDVEVPENEFGVKPGVIRNLETMKSFNIIKDGVLNMPLLGVEVSENLARRLRAVGCIEMGIIYKNLYLLDLGRIPIVSRADLVKYPSWVLAELEAKRYTAKIGQDFMRMHGEMKKPRSKKVSDAENFLRKLGIFRDKYYPIHEQRVQTGESYYTTELLTKISSLPDNTSDIIKSISSYLHGQSLSGGGAKIQTLKKVLDFINQANKPVEYWETLEKECVDRIRDIKFQMIMMKTGHFFKDHKRPRIEATKKRVEVCGTQIDVSWRFARRKVMI